MEVAVLGNSTLLGGFAVAADLALAGQNVRLAAWPGTEASLDSARARGGLELTGVTSEATSGRGGLAKPRLCGSLAEAVRGAEVVIIDVAPPEFEARFQALVGLLDVGQHVHVNMHGYWPSLRLAPLLRSAGREDVTLSESAAPTIAAAYSDGVVTLQWMRRKVPVGVFPANRTPAAIQRLRMLFPHVVAATNVLETSFASLNMMVHFALVLTNIGWCDRLLDERKPVPPATPCTRRASAKHRMPNGRRFARPPACRVAALPII